MSSAIFQLVQEGDPNTIFTFDKELAVGSFGTVYSATRKQDGKILAVKIVGLEEGTFTIFFKL